MTSDSGRYLDACIGRLSAQNAYSAYTQSFPDHYINVKSVIPESLFVVLLKIEISSKEVGGLRPNASKRPSERRSHLNLYPIRYRFPSNSLIF